VSDEKLLEATHNKMGLYSQEVAPAAPTTMKVLPLKPKKREGLELELKPLAKKPKMDVWNEDLLLNTPTLEQEAFAFSLDSLMEDVEAEADTQPPPVVEEETWGATTEETTTWDNNTELMDAFFHCKQGQEDEDELHCVSAAEAEGRSQPQVEVEEEATGTVVAQATEVTEQVYEFVVGTNNCLEVSPSPPDEQDLVASSLLTAGISLDTIDVTSLIDFSNSFPLGNSNATTETFVGHQLKEEEPKSDALELIHEVLNPSSASTSSHSASVKRAVKKETDPDWEPESEARDPDWVPDFEATLARPSTSRKRPSTYTNTPVYAKRTRVEYTPEVKRPSQVVTSQRKKPGRPERAGPYTIPSVPSRREITSSGMSSTDIEQLKYRRMRELNNQASKACRAKRKNKAAEMEEQVAVEEERKMELEARYASMLQQVEELRRMTGY